MCVARVCVACRFTSRSSPQVVDVLGDRVLIHFDGWEDSYDYWCDPSSPYIHPVGWCQENGKPLSPPNGESGWADRERRGREGGVVDVE